MPSRHAQRAEVLASLLAELNIADSYWWMDGESVTTAEMSARLADLPRLGVVSSER